jgi:DNA-binding CsgD family transcriptional regulator
MHIVESHARDTRSTGVAAPGLVVGLVSDEWIIRHISVDGPSLLGVPAEQAVGSSLLTFIHPTDQPDVVGGAVSPDGSSSVVVKMGGPGRWVPVRLAVTPMVGGALGVTITGCRSAEAEHRMTVLEQHLWRIAREIEAAGIPLAPEPTADLASLPALDDLSPRQWDVLRRLLRGERVPGIARSLYVSPSTVRNHLTAIFAKVGVHSQGELIERLRTHSVSSVPA